MNVSEHSSDSPGLSLQALLNGAKEPLLKKFLGEPTLKVLQALNVDIDNQVDLGVFAQNYVEPSETIRDHQRLTQIIDMLPIAKARELATLLGVKNTPKLYEDLEIAAAYKEAVPTLFSFFGVVNDVRVASERITDQIEIEPSYGLFDHQRRAAEKIKRALAQAPRKVLLHMPTGSGKTRTAMNIVADHLRLNEPTVVVWLAQSTELMEQAHEEFQKAWRSCGNRSVDLMRFWADSEANPANMKDGLIVAGLAKMNYFNTRQATAMLQLADKASLTIIDEAHQAIAPTYEAVLTALHTKRSTNALLGLTATPGRTWSDIEEDRKLSSYFDGQKVTLEIDGYDDPVTYLIENGYLAKPRYKTLKANSQITSAIPDTDAEIPDSVLEELGHDAQRNKSVTEAILDLTKRHRRIIVFTPSVPNARLLRAILQIRGVDAAYVTASTTSFDRDRIIRKFRSNSSHPMVLLNYGVLTTGFDAPATSAAVIARPTNSLVLYSQMVGRATRGPRAGGNAEAEIVTIVDPQLPGFGSLAEAFRNWEDVWNGRSC